MEQLGELRHLLLVAYPEVAERELARSSRNDLFFAAGALPTLLAQLDPAVKAHPLRAEPLLAC